MQLNFERDLEINPDELDIAALEQTTLAMRYSKELAKAERHVKECHERVKTLKAKLIKDANEFSDELLGKGVKATASNVESYYRSDEEYKQAKTDWINAEYDRDLIRAACSHIEYQRASAIKTLAPVFQKDCEASGMSMEDIAARYREYKQNRAAEAERAVLESTRELNTSRKARVPSRSK